MKNAPSTDRLPLLSLAHFTIIEADPVTLIDAAFAARFDAVGLRIVPPHQAGTIIPVVGDLPLQRRIIERLRDTGLRLLDIEAVWLTPETDIANLLPALDVGVALGAAHVIVAGHDPDRGRLVENLAGLCAACHARGLRLMLEFIPYSHVTTLAAAHALLDEIAPANAGLLVDALHLSRSGGRPADLAQYDPTLFTYMHLCDAPARIPPADGLRTEARGGRLYPGEGELWLADFIAAFAPGTPIAIEAPSALHASLSARDQARLAGDLCRSVLGGTEHMSK